MDQVLRWLADYQWWIYGLLGILMLFYLRRALMARRQGVRSIFKLEQEQYRARYGRSIGVLAIIVALMASVFLVSNPLLSAPMETPEPAPTETSGPLTAPTLTPTPPPATMTSTATATTVRPTRPVRPTDTPDVAVTDTPSAMVQSAACPNPNVRLTSPGVNQIVRGSFPIQGTARIENFQYYKVEIGPGLNPREQEWVVVGQLHYNPVTNGRLETLNSGAYSPGTYTLRLVVVDLTGNFPEPCRVTITVQR